MTTLGKLRKALFGIPSEKAVFSRPGFAPEAWERFQPVAHALVEGYHATLEDSRFEALVPRLDAIEAELHGFAYEGAAMGLVALDILAPWKNRLQDFVEGPGAPHIYPIYVGVGLALARLHRRPEPFLARLGPLLCWVVVDGYGFHEGFFSYHRSIEEQAVPAHLSPYARRLFDQGLGRSIWFSTGASVERAAMTIGAFPEARHADLWSGVGLACSYAGGVDRTQIERLRSIADPYRPQLARGAVVAAKGRHQANNMAPHTEIACEVFCGLPSEMAVRIADDTREDLPTSGPTPAYEIWRQRIQSRFATYEEIRS